MTGQTFVVDERGRHHIVIAEARGWPAARTLLLRLRSGGRNHRFIRPSQVYRTAWLQPFLSSQQMGTRLYIAGTAAFIAEVQKAAFAAGFSEAEQHVVRIGPPAPFVFCILCYHRFPHPGAELASCPNCGQRLEVTAHVSDRLESVMGSARLVQPQPENAGKRDEVVE